MTVFFLLAIVFFYSSLLKLSFIPTIKVLLYGLNSYCTVNQCQLKNFFDLNLYKLIYLAAIFSSLLLMSPVVFIKGIREKDDKDKEQYLKRPFYVFLILLFVILGTNVYFKRLIFSFPKANIFMDSEIKKSLLYGKVYKIAMFCKDKVKGYKKAELITDIDVLDVKGGLDFYRSLSYLIYPIDLRVYRSSRLTDLYIVFFTKPRKFAVPDGFKVITNPGDPVALFLREGSK